MDVQASYSREKDILAIGACIQNMLLQTCTLGLGACWMGEILNKASEVNTLLQVPNSFELLAVLAIGHPKELKMKRKGERRDLKELVFGSWPLF